MKILEVENKPNDVKWFSVDDDWTDSYPLIKQIAQATGATHWGNYGRIGVPWSNQMIGGSGTIIFRTPTGRFISDAGVDYHRGKPRAIILSQIAVENSGAGTGSQIMRAVKQYADRLGIGVAVYKVTNPEFFRRFSWLDEKSGSFYYNLDTDST